MKKKFLFLSTILLSFSIVQIHGYSQDLKWKGTIEEEDGIKVIKNPNEPLYGEITFELEEDLSIGNEEDENYLFYKIKDIHVDTEGNIYVIDTGNHRIQVFNKKGNYLRTIGKKGQGPGELNTPKCISIDNENGNILVVDSSRTISIFNKEGKHIDKDIHLDENLNDFYVDSKGNIWGKFFQPGIKPYYFIRNVNFRGEVVKTFSEIQFDLKRIMLSRTRFGNTATAYGYFFGHWYEYNLFISQVDNHTFIYGYSRGYELIEVDETGNTLFVIRKDEAPMKITRDEKEKVYDKIKGDLAKKGQFEPDVSIEFPEHKPYFYSIKSDNQSRIYISKNPISRESNINHEYDVFSKDGYYLYRIIIPIFPNVIEDGYFYTLSVNEETGEESVKRYKIKNWEQIKK